MYFVDNVLDEPWYLNDCYSFIERCAVLSQCILLNIYHYYYYYLLLCTITIINDNNNNVL